MLQFSFANYLQLPYDKREKEKKKKCLLEHFTSFSILQIKTYTTPFALIFYHWSGHGLRGKFSEPGQLTTLPSVG